MELVLERLSQKGRDNVMLANYFNVLQHIVKNPKWLDTDAVKYLLFDRDWNTLMPCIEKLAKTRGIHYTCWCDGDFWVYRFEEQGGGILAQGISNTNVDAAYKAVVEMVKVFIKREENA
jgi:hypothetical protein